MLSLEVLYIVHRYACFTFYLRTYIMWCYLNKFIHSELQTLQYVCGRSLMAAVCGRQFQRDVAASQLSLWSVQAGAQRAAAPGAVHDAADLHAPLRRAPRSVMTPLRAVTHPPQLAVGLRRGARRISRRILWNLQGSYGALKTLNVLAFNFQNWRHWKCMNFLGLNLLMSVYLRHS